MKKKLTAKREAFAKEYALNGGDASAAYRVAFSSDNMKPETVNNNAYKLLKNNEVLTRVKELQAKVAKVAEEEFKIDAAWVLKEQAYIYAVAKGEIPTKTMIKSRDQEGSEIIKSTEVVKHDLVAANKALETIGKHVNVQAWKDKVEHSGEINVPNWKITGV